ncbi:MAG: helix-turn-helix domain-containing protein, partial [Candidatus Eremiobacteraeota bacterium]|nr:helix-turn-helix domain-containing protein [Candidatus Eremiobacteraeota bacterium]
MAFGALLRRFRIDAGLSQAALAEAAGVSPSAIGAYEQGVHASPHRETIRLIAEALHLDPAGRLELEQAGRRPPKSSRPPGARDRSLGNLPQERSSFVGRSDEIRDIARLTGQHRLVTIVGPGGVGKTRLAQRVAAGEAAKWVDGSWFFDFAAIEQAEFVLSTIASVLGVQAQSAEGLASSLRSKRMLLIFDNCEHLIERISEIVAAFLRRCPDVTIVATSRAPLRMAGETVVRLSPLPVPIAGASTDAIMAAEAIALFVERARAADSNFHPTADDAPTIGDICRNLDGLPLAIEIASMRVPLIGLRALRDQIASVMSSKLPIRDLPARQQTLERTLDWSLALLDQTSQVIFYLLSVFVGGCTIEAAQFVCNRSSIGSSETIDGILQLSETSLINVDLHATSFRYTMHATTYALARRRLEQSERFNNVVRAHGDWLAFEAERYGRHVGERITRKRWHERFDPEIDNVRAALQNGIQGKLSARTVSTILCEFSPIWEDSALLIEYRKWISDAAPVICADIDPETLASFDFAKAIAALPQEELSSYGRAIESSRAAGGKNRRLTSLSGLFARAYSQTEAP